MLIHRKIERGENLLPFLFFYLRKKVYKIMILYVYKYNKTVDDDEQLILRC